MKTKRLAEIVAHMLDEAEPLIRSLSALLHHRHRLATDMVKLINWYGRFQLKTRRYTQGIKLPVQPRPGPTVIRLDSRTQRRGRRTRRDKVGA